MVPASEATKKRMLCLNEKDKALTMSATGSGFSRKMSNWIGRDMVYPDNVLYLSPETSNQSHSAVFPETLPTWFIKLFSKEGDTVLDPFSGAGTTSLAAKKYNRNYIGIEILKENVELAEKRIYTVKKDII